MIEQVPESVYYPLIVLAIIGVWQVGEWLGIIFTKLFVKGGKDE